MTTFSKYEKSIDSGFSSEKYPPDNETFDFASSDELLVSSGAYCHDILRGDAGTPITLDDPEPISSAYKPFNTPLRYSIAFFTALA